MRRVSAAVPLCRSTTHCPRCDSALATHANVVLQAPPGAGKSTGVPLALLDEPWLGAQDRDARTATTRCTRRRDADGVAAWASRSGALSVFGRGSNRESVATRASKS